VSAACDGKQFVGIDLHRRRSVISRTDQHGRPRSWVALASSPRSCWRQPTAGCDVRVHECKWEAPMEVRLMLEV
jgi:hypothetical protein